MANKTYQNIFSVLQEIRGELGGMRRQITNASEPRRALYQSSIFPGDSSTVGDRSSYSPLVDEKGYILFLPANQQFWLYRGQKQDYPNCLPKLYRDNPREIDIFLRRLQVTEFKLLLKTHPAVNELSDKKVHISFTGLAQHYGLRTELLDVTSDYRVAAFFAVCAYDRKAERFYPMSKEDSAFGVLYKTPPIMTMDFPPGISPGAPRLEPIGLQPFSRPEAQRSYGCEITPGTEFPAHKMKFYHSKEHSERIFETFNAGEDLLPDDPLAIKVQKIKEAATYSQRAFEITHEKYEYPETSSHYRRELRKTKGLQQRNEPPVKFSSDELKQFKKEWEENKKDFYKKILPFRKQYTGNSSNNR